ncbi:unnamed protein product, partial [Rotaria sp. Silwood2]
MATEMKDHTDISLKKLKRYMIHVQRLVDDFSDQLPFVTICLLDCYRVYCLRNPNLAKFTAKNPRSEICEVRDQKKIVNAGSLIGFACAPGTQADDNEKQANGLYTKHLLEHIVKPNRDIIK